MNRILWWIGGAVWFALVFAAVFLLTFPSGKAARRVAYEVNQRTNGAYHFQAAAVTPWWIGLRATNVIVSEVDRFAGADALPKPVFFGEDVGVHVGALSILRRAYAFTGYLVLGGSPLDFVVRTVPKDDRMAVRALEIEGRSVPITDLLGLIPSAGGVADLTGTVDIDVDLSMGQGLDKADGDVSIQGRGLVLQTMTVPAMGWEDHEVDASIDELDLRLRVDEGKGDVVRALLATNLAELDMDGTISFADQLDRSRIELDVKGELRDWTDTPLASFRTLVDQLLVSAHWSDNSYHWKVDTSLGRFSIADFRPSYEASRGSTRTPTSTPYRPTTPAPSVPPMAPTPPVVPSSVPAQPTVRPEPVVDDGLDGEPIEDDDLGEPNEDDFEGEEGDEEFNDDEPEADGY
ncbi:MAG: type II secretion system protein GspN [Alphaproteobacteria bacterium]|nr:type II secretion system protein GspN [Alphaproteobacteria bacterium]